jgi:hypothetical protein
MIEKPTAIIKTLPAHFFKEVRPRDFARSFLALNDNPEDYWLFHMGSGLPKHDVLHLYVVAGNRIRYRANIAGFEGPFDGDDYFKGIKRFADGRAMYCRHWMIVTGPIIIAPYRIERKGFQGFRYSEFIF